jgi:glycosyltransferase involved in cell wall biosynthesis
VETSGKGLHHVRQDQSPPGKAAGNLIITKDIPLYGWRDFSDTPVGQPFAADNPQATVTPRFSIVIPTLNQGEFIEGTLQSILRQSYRNFEIIVMDGGSTDDTLSVLDRYRPFLAKVVSQADGGQSRAINKGFDFATGTIFAWLNSDDLYLPDCLERVAACFVAQPETQLVIGAGDVISADQHFLRGIPAFPLSRELLMALPEDRWILQQSCFWTADLWRYSGGVDPDLHLLLDYDLWFRFLGTRYAQIHEKLAAMRWYPEAKTVRDQQASSEEIAVVYAKNGCLQELRGLVRNLVNNNCETQNQLGKVYHHPLWRALRRLKLA